MTREIKFRFWHLKDEKMIDWVWITQKAWNSFRADTPISLLFDFLTIKKDDVIIQQFTGVKDKNGNDVYEGDIVEVLNKPYECENSTVIWGKKSHGWRVKCKIIKNKAYDPAIKYYGLESSCNIEVIGNIYEHSHLI